MDTFIGGLQHSVIQAIMAATNALLYLGLLPIIFHHLLQLTDPLKVMVSLGLIAPLAFCMGMPFPSGLTRLTDRFGTYPLKNLRAFSPKTHETAHGGYDPTFANQDPNRILPLDAVRELEDQGAFGSLHPYYYATVGNATPVAKAQPHRPDDRHSPSLR